MWPIPKRRQWKSRDATIYSTWHLMSTLRITRCVSLIQTKNSCCLLSRSNRVRISSQFWRLTDVTRSGISVVSSPFQTSRYMRVRRPISRKARFVRTTRSLSPRNRSNLQFSNKIIPLRSARMRNPCKKRMNKRKLQAAASFCKPVSSFFNNLSLRRFRSKKRKKISQTTSTI